MITVPVWFLTLCLLAAPACSGLFLAAGVFFTHRLMKGLPPIPSLPKRTIKVEAEGKRPGFSVPVMKV
jgi:hypothetical protein